MTGQDAIKQGGKGLSGVKAQFNRLLVGAGLLALVAMAAFTVRLALGAQKVAAEAETAQQRASAADAARWTGLAEAYVQNRARQAEAARWTGLAGAYQSQRAADAYAARSTGQAIQLYVETGDAALLPTCVSTGLLAALPRIGDDAWRAQVAICGE